MSKPTNEQAAYQTLHNAKPAKTGGLSEEQLTALQDLSTFRVWLSNNSESASFGGTPEFAKITEQCGKEDARSANGIRERVSALFGCAPFCRIDWVNDHTMWLEPDYNAADDRGEYLQKIMDDNFTKFDKINNQVVQFLEMMDENYGTKFATI